ncbi:hypothetical protein FQZ97_730980 [compost metagenome]
MLTAEATDAANNTAGIGAVGSGYDDTFFGSEGNDVINGGGGWNVLMDGSKVWSATQGMDVVDYGWATHSMQVNLQSGVAVGMGNDTLKNIEGLKGGFFADAFSDNAANNQLEGRGGNDVFFLVGGGNDTLKYGMYAHDATGGNDHDMVLGFTVGNLLDNANADRIDLSEVLGYNGPVGLHQDAGVLKLDAASQGLLDYINTSVVGNDTVISIDRDGSGSQFGFTDVVTLNGVNTDLLSLLQNHQLVV